MRWVSLDWTPASNSWFPDEERVGGCSDPRKNSRRPLWYSVPTLPQAPPQALAPGDALDALDGQAANFGCRYLVFDIMEAACELKFAVRTLAKTPGFALTCVLVLSVGIAVSTAAFSVVMTAVTGTSAGRLEVPLWCQAEAWSR